MLALIPFWVCSFCVLNTFDIRTNLFSTILKNTCLVWSDIIPSTQNKILFQRSILVIREDTKLWFSFWVNCFKFFCTNVLSQLSLKNDRLLALVLSPFKTQERSRLEVGNNGYFQSHECRHDPRVEIYITRSGSWSI